MVKVQKISFFNTKRGLIMLGIVSLILAYFVGSRAIDTGSLGQYGVTFVLTVFGFNRLIRAIRGV